ncbi:MAG: Phage protein [Candidatus Saccharibacteria bacterium]|nr:Phage protein [Candidatus Saccharibacteria bacterium]
MVGNLEHKIKELDYLLVDAVKNYQSPERFFTYSHSLIQACRNLTFAVQSNKKEIPNFDTWYLPWRETMKADPYMKWLHAKRTKVVHEDVIASESYASLITLTDYARVIFEAHYDYRTSTDDVIANAKQQIIDKPELSYATMEVERMYRVDVEGKSDELIHVLIHVFQFLCMLVSDLEIYLDRKDGYQGPPLNLGNDIENDLSYDDSFRFARFKFRSGESVGGSIVPIVRDDKMVQLARERYGEVAETISSENVNEAAKSLFRIAKFMIQKDGSYLSMAFVHTSTGFNPLAAVFRDRSEKILFSHQLAAYVNELSGDAVIFIAETWTITDVKKWDKRIKEGKEIGGMRNKKEALSLMMLGKDGTSLGITAAFTRVDGQIVFDEENVDYPSPEEMGFFIPVYAMWNDELKSQQKKV